MTTSLSIHLKFLEPYRLVEFGNPEFLRGRSFACLNKKDGKAIITGTLLRSAALKAAEELLSLKGGKLDNNTSCCNGNFKTTEEGRKVDKKLNPRFFRKRPVLKWPNKNPGDDSCKENDLCLYCLLLGRADKSKKGEGRKKKENYLIHFDNLYIDGDLNKDNFSQRILNRVDPRTGKAFDYFKVWEVEDEDFWKYKGKITINDGVDALAIKLLEDSLRFVDRLCGALCVIDVKEDKTVASSPPDKNTQGQTQPSPDSNLTVKIAAPSARNDTIDELAREVASEINTIFIKTQKIERLRSFADGIRALRLKNPGDISNLPRGKDNKHFLWDMDNGGRSIRKILEETVSNNASLKDKRNWIEFCNTLGNELYKRYKESAGGIIIPERILGDTEYYSKQAAAGEVSWIKSKGDVKEWIFTGYLKAETPFFFGTEAKGGDQTSIQILLDKKSGQYRIPRSVLRGILRNDLRLAFGTGCSVELGGERPCDCPVCMVMRKITIMDAKSDFKEPPEVRHRIRQNPYTGTVDEGALFDIEVGPEGVTFPFILRYRGEGDNLPKELTNVLHLYEDGTAFFGGSGSTGKGRFSLQELKVFKWDFSADAKEGLKSYIENRGLRKGLIEEKSKTIAEILNNKYAGLTEDKLQSKSPDFNPSWTKVEYEIHIKSPLLSADPIEALFDSRNADSVVYKKRVVHNGRVCNPPRPVYKGESIRGLVRTAVGMRTGDLAEEHEDCSCSLCSIFGNEHEAGKIRFEDLIIENPVEKRMDHVAIDRFTSGAADKKKFDDYPIQGNSVNPIILKGRFWVRDTLSDYKKIIDSLCDIRDGLYPLGGKGGIGYGWVTDLIVTSPSDFILPVKTKPTNADIKKAPSPFEGVESCDLNLDSNKVYSPHYFLKPHETVKREPELIGHEKFQDDKLTGKIKCKLTTLTPLIIPDTGNENAFDLQKDHPGHKNFKIFRINDKEIIPGSEIRGVVGTVYEALTNSCFRVMEEKRYLTRRIKPETDIKQGIVEKDKDTGKFKIKEVTEVYRLPLYENREITDKISEKNREQMSKDYKIKSAIEWNNEVAKIAKINRTIINPKEDKMEILAGRKEVCFKLWGSNPNDKIVCLCEDDKSGEIKKGYIKFTGLNMILKGKEYCYTPSPTIEDVRTLEILHNDFMGRKPPNSNRKYPRPILQFGKDNYKYTIPKRCERVFVTPEDVKEYEVPPDVINRYRDVLQDYASNYGRFDERFITTAVIDHMELEEGDLVYFLPSKKDGNKVEAIMPVPISRIGDTKPLGKRMPYGSDALRPCEREILEDINTSLLADFPEKYLFRRYLEGLCPACRLFGTTGYKGRVRFGFAEHQGELRWLMGAENGSGKPLTLPLLEKPRPTWSMPNNEAKVPGRKFYVHHNGWKKVKNNPSEPKTENNRTVEPLSEGNEFTFEVFFENLEEWELGLLLYSLELEENMAHKIGMGKALGFGSVKIKVENILLRTEHNNWTDSTKCKNAWLQKGFDELKFGKNWYEVQHIMDLRCLLKIQTDENIDVRYPKLRQEDDTEKHYPGYVELKGQQRGRDYLIKPWEPWHNKIVIATPDRIIQGETISKDEGKIVQSQDTSHKAEGTVKWFNESKGYGFIKQKNGEDAFVHYSAIKSKGFKTLKEGDRVKFDTKQGEKGLQAYDVEII